MSSGLFHVFVHHPSTMNNLMQFPQAINSFPPPSQSIIPKMCKTSKLFEPHILHNVRCCLYYIEPPACPPLSAGQVHKTTCLPPVFSRPFGNTLLLNLAPCFVTIRQSPFQVELLPSSRRPFLRALLASESPF
jgi:hypothetical protein